MSRLLIIAGTALIAACATPGEIRSSGYKQTATVDAPMEVVAKRLITTMRECRIYTEHEIWPTEAAIYAGAGPHVYDRSMQVMFVIDLKRDGPQTVVVVSSRFERSVSRAIAWSRGSTECSSW
jgi:hypothetical protein